jgi:hypothetical protein
MKLNIDLNEELGIRIFSFPMRYQPIDLKDRSHIGDNWHRFYLRSMQIILQATHGIVSGAPDYFKEAFGDNTESYKELLLWPHHYLFNRQWYKKYGGTPELEEYLQKLSKLTPNEKNELLEVLTLNPSAYKKDSISRTNKVKSIVMDHYLPLQTVDERKIWDAMRKQRKVSDDFNLPEDERVEDAGLSEKVA